MSDESFQAAPDGVSEAVEAAPVLDATAASGSEGTGEPAGEEGAPENKTFTQDEYERALQKERAKTERRVRREFQQAAERPQPITVGEAPDPSMYESALDYADALAEHKAALIVAQREQQTEQAKTNSTFNDRMESARDKYEDFDAVALNEDLPITPAMGKVIKNSEVGTDVAYYLGKNPNEAARIAGLDVLDQAVELGKLVARLTGATPPAKRTTNAPAPISPVGASTTNSIKDPLDPRSTKSMTPKQWIDARNAQEAARRQ